MDELEDPDYGSVSDVKRRAKTQAHLIGNFQTRWKHEYLISLRKFHKSSGNNLQRIKVGDVVLIHDEGPRINWRLAVIKNLIVGGDGLVRAADIQTSTGRTNRPITKLYPLEVTANTETKASLDQSQDGSTVAAEREETATTIPAPQRRPQRVSARLAAEKMMKWKESLLGPPEDVEM